MSTVLRKVIKNNSSNEIVIVKKERPREKEIVRIENMVEIGDREFIVTPGYPL